MRLEQQPVNLACILGLFFLPTSSQDSERASHACMLLGLSLLPGRRPRCLVHGKSHGLKSRQLIALNK